MNLMYAPFCESNVRNRPKLGFLPPGPKAARQWRGRRGR